MDSTVNVAAEEASFFLQAAPAPDLLRLTATLFVAEGGCGRADWTSLAESKTLWAPRAREGAEENVLPAKYGRFVPVRKLRLGWRLSLHRKNTERIVLFRYDPQTSKRLGEIGNRCLKVPGGGGTFDAHSGFGRTGKAFADCGGGGGNIETGMIRRCGEAITICDWTAKNAAAIRTGDLRKTVGLAFDGLFLKTDNGGQV